MLKSEWVDDSADDSDCCEIIFESAPGVLFKPQLEDSGKKGANKTPSGSKKTVKKSLPPKGKSKAKGKAKGKGKAQHDDDDTESEPDAGSLDDDDSDYTCESFDDDDLLDADDGDYSPFKGGLEPAPGARRITRRSAAKLKQTATHKLELEDTEDEARSAAGSSRRAVVIKPPLPGLRKPKPRPQDFEWQRTDSEAEDDMDEVGLDSDFTHLCESATAGLQRQLRALSHKLVDTQQPTSDLIQELQEQWHALVQDALAASSLERELRVELLDCLLDHIRALLAQSHDDAIDASRCAADSLCSQLIELLWGAPGFMDLVCEPKRGVTLFTPEALHAVGSSPAQLPALLFCMGAVAGLSPGLRDQLARKTSIIAAIEQLCIASMKAQDTILLKICYLIRRLSKNARMASDLAVSKGTWSFALSCLGRGEPLVLRCALQAIQAMLARSSESTAERLVDSGTLEDMCNALDRMLTTTAGPGDGEEGKATTVALQLLKTVVSSSPTNAQRLQSKLDELDDPFSGPEEALEPLCNAIEIALQSCVQHQKSRSGGAVVKVEDDSSEEEPGSHMAGRASGGGSKMSGYSGSAEIEEEEEFDFS